MEERDTNRRIPARAAARAKPTVASMLIAR
jgi:hypothetical protein